MSTPSITSHHSNSSSSSISPSSSPVTQPPPSLSSIIIEEDKIDLSVENRLRTEPQATNPNESIQFHLHHHQQQQQQHLQDIQETCPINIDNNIIDNFNLPTIATETATTTATATESASESAIESATTTTTTAITTAAPSTPTTNFINHNSNSNSNNSTNNITIDDLNENFKQNLLDIKSDIIDSEIPALSISSSPKPIESSLLAPPPPQLQQQLEKQQEQHLQQQQQQPPPTTAASSSSPSSSTSSSTSSSSLAQISASSILIDNIQVSCNSTSLFGINKPDDIDDNSNHSIKPNNNNNNSPENILDEELDDNLDHIFPTITTPSNDIDQLSILNTTDNTNLIDSNTNCNSPINQNSPHSICSNSNSSSTSTTSNSSSSSSYSSGSSSSSSSSSGGSVLAQTNASSATISGGLSSTSSPFSGANSNTTIITGTPASTNTNNNNNNNTNILLPNSTSNTTSILTNTIHTQQSQNLILANVCSPLLNHNNNTGIVSLISPDKQENILAGININSNNSNTSTNSGIDTEITNTIISEQMNIKDESTGNLLDSGKPQIKVEDEPPACRTPILSEINIKTETKNLSPPLILSATANNNNNNNNSNNNNNNNNNNGSSSSSSSSSSLVKNINACNVGSNLTSIGSTNTGSLLHIDGSCGPDIKKHDDNICEDMLPIKDEMLLTDNTNTAMATLVNIKKEEPGPDISSDNFSPLCTQINIGNNSGNGNGGIVGSSISSSGSVCGTVGGVGVGGGSVGGGNNINMQQINICEPQKLTGNLSQSCQNPSSNTPSSILGNTNVMGNTGRSCGRMEISPPATCMQSMSTSNTMNLGNNSGVGGGGGIGSSSNNNNTIGGISIGGNINNNNNNAGGNSKQQMMGNNSGMSGMDYMQQQNHIFVFSTQLANKGADSVLNGQFPTIIAYHCAQPTTKKFLEDFFLKNPMKLSKMNRQHTVNTQWIQQQQNLNNNNNSHKIIQNKLNSNNNNSSINTNNNNNNNNNNVNINRMATSTVSLKSSASSTTTTGQTTTSTPNLHSITGNSFGNDELTGPDSDLLTWEQNANHLNLNTLANGSNPDGMDDGTGLISNESPTHGSGGGGGPGSNTSSIVGHGGQMQSLVSSSALIQQQQQSPTMLTSSSLGPTSPSLAGLQPSLQGVKVPDENLTPQQRQHREEQLAKLKKMNQFLFPEHTSGMGPEFIGGPGGDGSTDPSIGGPSVGGPTNPKMMAVVGPGGSVVPASSIQTSNNQTVNPGVGMLGSGGVGGGVPAGVTITGTSPNNMPGMSGMVGGNGPIPAGMNNPLGPNGTPNMRNVGNMMSVGGGGGGGIGSRGGGGGPMCRQLNSLGNMPENMMGGMNDFGMMMGNHGGPPNSQSMMGGMMGNPGPMGSHGGQMGPGGLNPCSGMGGMIGGQKNMMGGMAQMEWNKLQHQYYEERTKGKGGPLDGMPMGRLCNNSQNISGGVIGPNCRQGGGGMMVGMNPGNQSSGPGVMRQNSQNCSRSQGPPPPYHQTPRSASVPIATQSPNPSSPNNPTSNLSLPSPRTGGSTLNSPAGEVSAPIPGNCSQNNTNNKTQQMAYKQDSPVGGGGANINTVAGNSSGNNRNSLSHSSNPSTPISSHMSPNASLKDHELGNTSSGNNNQVDKNRLNTSGPSPQGPRTPLMTGDHSNPASIDSRFPPASPSINFSPATSGQQNQSQNNAQQQGGLGCQKIPVFMEGSSMPNNSGKCSTSTNEASASPFCIRADNLPLNPNSSCPPPAKTSHFDPISSLAQMSQQLTNSVSSSANGGPGGNAGLGNPGMLPGYPNHGGMVMSPGDLSLGPHGSIPDGLMGGPGMGIDPCGMNMNLAGMGGGGPPGGLSGGPGGQYVIHGGPNSGMGGFGQMGGGPPRSLSPKMGGGMMGFPGSGPVGMQTHRMLGRPMGGPGSGNPYNGANIQVKASTPNTIQYLPARPQVGNNNPRAPPSLEFLQRFANPMSNMDNGPPNKISGGGPGGGGQNISSFYSNCNQIGGSGGGIGGGGGINMNHPHGMVDGGLSGPDNNGMMNMGMVGVGPGGNPGNSMCGPMGQNIMMRGLRPPGQGGGGGGGMLRMPVSQNMNASPVGHHHHHHHPFSNVPHGGNNPNDPSMFPNQMFGGGGGGQGVVGPSGGNKGNSMNHSMIGGGPNSGNVNVSQMQQQMAGNMGGGVVNVMQSEAGQSGGVGGGVGGMGNGGPVGGGVPGNFKSSQFVGPSTADPNYAQQYHNFQQQLYATSTRSQPGGPGGNNSGVVMPGGGSSNANQSFFVPK